MVGGMFGTRKDRDFHRFRIGATSGPPVYGPTGWLAGIGRRYFYTIDPWGKSGTVRETGHRRRWGTEHMLIANHSIADYIHCNELLARKSLPGRDRTTRRLDQVAAVHAQRWPFCVAGTVARERQ